MNGAVAYVDWIESMDRVNAVVPLALVWELMPHVEGLMCSNASLLEDGSVLWATGDEFDTWDDVVAFCREHPRIWLRGVSRGSFFCVIPPDPDSLKKFILWYAIPEEAPN